MWIINTDTNCTVGGFPIPLGSFEMPFHGSLGILTSGGANTNFSVNPGDTLFIWGTGAALDAGTDPWQFFLLGLSIILTGAGMIAFARRMGAWLSFGKVKEV